MKNVLLTVIGNVGNEAETIRQILENFGFLVLRINVGRPYDLISILSDKVAFKYQYLIICSHGEDGNFIMDKLDESIYYKGEPKNNFGMNEFDKYLKIHNKLIISTGCTTGNFDIANIILKNENSYIAPKSFVNGDLIILFTTIFFYNIKRGKTVLESYNFYKNLFGGDNEFIIFMQKL